MKQSTGLSSYFKLTCCVNISINKYGTFQHSDVNWAKKGCKQMPSNRIQRFFYDADVHM